MNRHRELTWEDGQITGATLRAERAHPVRVRTGVPMMVAGDGGQVAVQRTADGVVSFATTAGVTYRLTRQ